MSDDGLGYTEPGSPTHVFDIEKMGGSPEKVRERVQLAGSGTVLAEVVRVRNDAAASTDYGLVVRPIAVVTRSDTYTGAANGTTASATGWPPKHFALQVVGTGAAATAWEVRLEGSLNGSNWMEMARHTQNDGDGIVVPQGFGPFPLLHLRTRCVSVTLGGATNIVATLLGVP